MIPQCCFRKSCRDECIQRDQTLGLKVNPACNATWKRYKEEFEALADKSTYEEKSAATASEAKVAQLMRRHLQSENSFGVALPPGDQVSVGVVEGPPPTAELATSHKFRL